MAVSKRVRVGFVADTHNDHSGLVKRAVEQMRYEVGGIDALFHLGDFLDNYNERPGSNPYSHYKAAARKLGELRESSIVENIYVIPGNHDIRHPQEGLCELEDFCINKRTVNVGGYSFFGYGGGFSFANNNGWEGYRSQRYEVNKNELSGLLNGADVLVLHQLDDSKKGSLREVIKKQGPSVVISGHTHKHGVDFYDSPIYASCGPIQPLDQTDHKRVGKSSFGVLELSEDVKRVKLFFFGKEEGEYKSRLHAHISIED